jgi:hypothetical protein
LMPADTTDLRRIFINGIFYLRKLAQSAGNFLEPHQHLLTFC